MRVGGDIRRPCRETNFKKLALNIWNFKKLLFLINNCISVIVFRVSVTRLLPACGSCLYSGVGGAEPVPVETQGRDVVELRLLGQLHVEDGMFSILVARGRRRCGLALVSSAISWPATCLPARWASAPRRVRGTVGSQASRIRVDVVVKVRVGSRSR